jgi:hypothetical protein
MESNYLTVMDERGPMVTRLYVHRLRRLLEVEPAASEELTSQEQRRLRSRAVLLTVRTLTAMGEGPAASKLLRKARRR